MPKVKIKMDKKDRKLLKVQLKIAKTMAKKVIDEGLPKFVAGLAVEAAKNSFWNAMSEKYDLEYGHYQVKDKKSGKQFIVSIDD